MKKEQRLILAISCKEKRELAEEARKKEMSMSEFIRELFRAYIVRERGIKNQL